MSAGASAPVVTTQHILYHPIIIKAFSETCDHLPAYEVLEDGGLARTLSSYHGDLRQLQTTAPAEDTERLVESVHQRNELLHPLVPHDYNLDSAQIIQRVQMEIWGKRCVCPAGKK